MLFFIMPNDGLAYQMDNSYQESSPPPSAHCPSSPLTSKLTPDTNNSSVTPWKYNLFHRAYTIFYHFKSFLTPEHSS